MTVSNALLDRIQERKAHPSWLEMSPEAHRNALDDDCIRRRLRAIREEQFHTDFYRRRFLRIAHDGEA